MIMFDNVKKIIQTDVGKRTVKCCPECGSFELEFLDITYHWSGIQCNSCGCMFANTKNSGMFTDEKLFHDWNKETRK